MRRIVVWVTTIGIVLASMLIALLVSYDKGLIDSVLSELILASAIVVVSYAYGSLAILGMVDARERNIRPVISLDLAVFDDEVLPGFGFRVRNCGHGPALDVQMAVSQEPENPAFKMSTLPALVEGVPVLDRGDERIISGGQPYATLSQMDDGHYRVRVRYRSIKDYPYKTEFTLRPQRDHHLLRSTIPKSPKDFGYSL